MVRLLIILLVIGGAVIFILKELYLFLGGISGTNNAALKDFVELEGLVDSFELSPWDPSELDLISRNHMAQAKKPMYAYVEYGYFISIYEEPIMAFATKEYNNNSRRLAVVKFNNKKYRFSQYEGKVDLYRSDGKTIGKVSVDNGLKINLKGKEVFIESHATSGLIPLSIDSKHILGIATADDQTGTGGRMLRKINDYKSEEGELILLSIAFALANKQI